MTTTLPATLTGLSYADIAAITGQQLPMGNNLPRLGINKDIGEDPENKPLPLGAYQVTLQNGTVAYGRKVKFRPFINAYQYSIYDQDKKAYSNRCTIFKNFREEAVDELGGVKCGKVARKVYKDMADADKKTQDGIKLYRLLYGTVTFEDGIDKDGNSVEVKDLPVLWRTRGQAFMPIQEKLDMFDKAKRPLFAHDIILGKPKREKNGDTVYYIPVLTPDFVNSYPLGGYEVEVLNLLKAFEDTIQAENATIVTKYQKATKYQSEDGDSQDLVKDLADDFNDDLPF